MITIASQHTSCLSLAEPAVPEREGWRKGQLLLLHLGTSNTGSLPARSQLSTMKCVLHIFTRSVTSLGQHPPVQRSGGPAFPHSQTGSTLQVLTNEITRMSQGAGELEENIRTATLQSFVNTLPSQPGFCCRHFHFCVCCPPCGTWASVCPSPGMQHKAEPIAMWPLFSVGLNWFF